MLNLKHGNQIVVSHKLLEYGRMFLKYIVDVSSSHVSEA